MEPTYRTELVSQFLNGVATEEMLMVKLMGQMVVILFAGFIVWRAMTAFSRKSKQRKKSMFEDSRFQAWKRR
jgi:hypothetical protein